MANESFEVFSLTSKLGLDTAQFDRAYGASQVKMRALVGDLKKVETGTASVGSQVTQLVPAFGGLQSALTGTVSPLNAVVGGFTALLGAELAVATGLFELTKHAAEFGSKIHDAAQEAGSTAETISTLAYAAKLSGKNLDDVTPAIKKFETTIGDAAKESKEATAALTRLGLDPKKAITDLDGSLAKAFKTIHDAGGGIAQVNLAADAFGKKSGPKMISVVETADGDFLKFQQHAKQLGVVLSTDAANAADEFGDKLDQVTERVKFLGIQFGLNLAPQILGALNVIDHGISDLPKTIGVVTALTRAAIETEVIAPLRIVEAILNGLEHPHSIPVNILFSGPPALLAYFLGQGVAPTPAVGADVEMGGGILRKSTPNYGGGGGGGKKGGGSDAAKIAEKMAKLQLDATLNGLKAEQDVNKRALDLRRRDFNEYATQYIVIETRRHEAVIKSLDAEQRTVDKMRAGKAKDLAALEVENARAEEKTTHEQNRNSVLDERARILDQIDDFLRDQDRTINSLTSSTTQWDEAYQQLVDTLKAEGVTLEENTRIRIEANMARAKELELVLSVTRARRVSESTRERVVTKAERERPPWIDLGNGSTVGGEPATTGRPRVATVEEQVRRERAAILREQTDRLAEDLTWTIDGAITEGFRHGVKAGVIEFGLGILEMARHKALEQLQKAIADALFGAANGAGGGGGGFFSQLLTKGLSVLLGGVMGGGFGGGSVGGVGGGAAGTIGEGGAMGLGGHARGGYMPPNSWSWVGERGPELVKAGSHGASVMSNSDSLAMSSQPIINMTVYANDAQSFARRETQTQIRNRMMRELKAA